MVYIDASAYLYSLLGGFLLGFSTSLNYILRGKVTGMSGTFYSIVSLNKHQIPQKLTLIAGMIVISSIFFDIFGYTQGPFSPFGSKHQITAGLSYYGYLLSGFLVGVGTKLGNGCTSGHGLCGLPRLSIRSIVAVVIFVTTGIGISSIRYYKTLGFFSNQQLNPKYVQIDNLITANVFLGIGCLLPFISYLIQRNIHTEKHSIKNYFKDQAIIFCVGILFGLGLMISGMTRRSKIKGFLQINQNWDPSLLIVLASGVSINLITFNYMLYIKKQPLMKFHHKLFNPKNSNIDFKLIAGAFIFGIGWGIGSLCPGPFLMLFPVFSIQIHIMWGVMCVLGMHLIQFITRQNKLTPQIRTQPTAIPNQIMASDEIVIAKL